MSKKILEFDRQIKVLLELKIIHESKSPDSSPAFMVKIMRRLNEEKPIELNKYGQFDGCFLSHKDT